jgi:sugar phosphate permease
LRLLKLSPPGAVLAILCGMYFLYFVNRTNLAIAGPVMRADLGLNNADLGIVFAAFGAPYALLQPLGGAMSDRLGPRRTLALCALIVCIATAWMGAAGGMASLFLARLLLGIGEGAGFPAATRAMSAWTPRSRWGFAQGITHTFSRIGNAATALIVAGLITAFSWRVAFFALVAATLVWLVIWLSYFRDDPRQHPAMTEETLAGLPPRGTSRPSIPWLGLARHIAPVTLVDFCYGWFLAVFQTWIPSFFIQVYRLDLGKTALFSTAVLLAGVVGDTVGGVLSDEILSRTANLRLARRGVIVLGFMGACGFLVPVLFTHDLTTATVCLALSFFFAELIVAPIWAVPMDMAPAFAGTASGMMNFGFGVASIVSPAFFGYSIERTHNWTLAFGVSIAVLLLGALLASRLRPDRVFAVPKG